MPVFEYTGRTPTGQTVSGTLEAKNKQELMQLLRRQRVIVTNVKRKSKSLNLTIGTGVKAVEISRFTRQFAVMIEAGLPLVQCLDILAAQTTNKVLAKVIANVRDTVSSDVILKRLADYREKADAIKRKIKGALTYPAIMLVMLVLISFIMLTFIIPIFAGMFEGLGAELPKPTQIVINLSNWLKGNLHLIIGGAILIVIIYKLMRKNSKTRYYIDYLFLKLPLFGMLIRKTAVARFSRTLGTLIQSGVNIIDALQVTAKTAGNDVIAKAIKNAIIAISQGETIAKPLEESGVFPPMVVQMINVGEKTGNLDTMLAKIADFYEEEVDSAVETLTAMIEPLMTIIMGIVVGGLLVAMYLPMFDIIGKIKA